MVTSMEVRWLVVKAVQFNTMPRRKILSTYGISLTTYRRIMRLWRRTKDVVPEGKPGHRGPVPNLTDDQKDQLVKLLVDEPQNLLKEHHADFVAITGEDSMHISTFCRAVAALGFSRKRLRAFARKRDADKALQFKAFLVAHFHPSQLFFLDETSKNHDALRRDFGYALRGTSPRQSGGYMPKKYSCSSLCGFDINGFVNWYTIRKTFNRKEFMDACEASVVRGLQPCTARRHRARSLARARALAESAPSHHPCATRASPHPCVTRFGAICPSRRVRCMLFRSGWPRTVSVHHRVPGPAFGCHPGQCHHPPHARIRESRQRVRWHGALHAAILLRLHALGQRRVWLREALPAEARAGARERAAGARAGQGFRERG